MDWAERAPGDIGALHGDDFPVSPAIIEGERLAGEIKAGSFEASHIFVVSISHIFEAIWPRISLSPWPVYSGRSTRVYRIDVPEVEKLRALLTLQNQWLGQHYDLVGVIGMGMLEIGRFLSGHNVEINAFASSHSAWCSELGTNYLEMLPLGDTEVPKATDPQQVVNFLDGLCGTGTGTA